MPRYKQTGQPQHRGSLFLSESIIFRCNERIFLIQFVDCRTRCCTIIIDNISIRIDEIPTIHEGVTAQALERKGIISNRCEINRQIKADNVLLRELKAAARKLAQAVKDTLPAIAEAMEKLRANMIVFRYQLRHIGRGRQRMKEYIHAVQPKLVRYTGLVQEIRSKSKERKSLLAEKKETPFYHIPKQHELSCRIAELTEELEELKSEKDMLLHSLECSDDAGIAAVKRIFPR